MDSVVEFFDCLIVCSLIVSKFSHFSLFHPSLFIQYSTEECSTVQLLASSLEYPERIRVDSVVETLVFKVFLDFITDNVVTKAILFNTAVLHWKKKF